MNTVAIHEALTLMRMRPERWLQGSPRWAARDGKNEYTGLAGHIVWAAGGMLYWPDEEALYTNYVRADVFPAKHVPTIAAYMNIRNLEWPPDTCSIFLAARLLADLDELTAMQLFTKNGSVEYTRGLLHGYEIGKEA